CVDRTDSFCLSGGGEVVGVGVGVTQNGEARVLEVSHVARRDTERVTLTGGGRRALASRRRGGGAFEGAEDDLRALGEVRAGSGGGLVRLGGQVGGGGGHRGAYRRHGHPGRRCRCRGVAGGGARRPCG